MRELSDEQEITKPAEDAAAPLAVAESRALAHVDSRPPTRPIEWAKLLFPVIVILLYIIGRMVSGVGSGPKSVQGVDEAKTLSGVSANAPSLKLTREAKAFLAEMETLVATDSWGEIAKRTANAPEAIRDHPVVRGFALLAKYRTQKGDVFLEREMTRVAALLDAKGDFAALREQLDVAQARLILDRATSLDLLLKNAETIQRLMEGTRPRPTVLDARVRIAQRYEKFADVRFEESKRVMGNDTAGLREARALHQTALRWIVLPEGWRTLTPYSESMRPHVARVVGKIQVANQAINSIALPFTDRDSSTWTGKKGDPIHDEPWQ